MAVEAIVGGLVTGLVLNVITKLGTEAILEFASIWGVNKEVAHLKNTLDTIQEYLADAEQKQGTDKEVVGSWLTRIKDAVYDAEDIIDDFVTEAERRKRAKQDKIFKTSKPHLGFRKSRFGFRLNIARRVKQVRETLRRIKDDQPSGLLRHIPKQNSGFIPTRPQTHSRLTEPKVVGRNKEGDEIVKLLLDSSGGDNVTVIPITGMGGIGKTTFAKYLYNHDQVVDHFKDKKGVINRWWVCVSNDTGDNAVQTITKKIIESVTGEKCPDVHNDLLQTRLEGDIRGKMFLLVLDDVWNENEIQLRELRGLLSGGASGSKIIITTRSQEVGSLMATNSNLVHKLSELSYDHCLELFKSIAFDEAEDQSDPELVHIGRSIVRKCGGLPLAARVLGGLCYRKDKQMWENVRDDKIWNKEKNDILRELMISYNYLPIQMKNCFAYCSIFPKKYRIVKDMLIQYWIAHGLIYSSRDTESLEDVCNYYIDVLMSRSFFQEAKLDALDSVISFTMHDFVNDLAKSVAGVEFFTVCEDVKNFPEGIRHLFFDIEVLSSHLSIIPKQIRTLVFSSKIRNFDGDIFLKLKFLRVLQFSDDYIFHLPNSIGNLKHLRYLQIECGNVTELPESITDLQNLQALNLECEMLHILPESIRKMINLKHIYLKYSVFSNMPLGLKELTSLRTLSRFIVSNDNDGCELNGLDGLINLGGTLCIENLDNVKNAKENEKTNLKTKSNLQCLGLYWGMADFNRERIRNIINRETKENTNRGTIHFEVLTNLEPHSNLKYLFVEGYKGTSFACWMMDPLPSLSNIVEIRLDNCVRCEKLPPFRRLPFLKVLELREISGAGCFEDNLEQSSGMEWFPCLTRLEIHDALNLESWVAMKKQEEEEGLFILISFPRLVSLRISNCPKLKNLPRLLPSLVDLDIINCPKLKNMPHLPPSIETLDLRVIPNHFSVAMEQTLSLSNLVNISIWQCIGCKQLPPFSLLPSLKSLELVDMDELQCFQGELESSQKEWFRSLLQLKIRDAPNLESWVVTGQQQQQGLSLSFSFPCLVELDITKCPKLKNMPSLPCIEDVCLDGCSGEVVRSVFNPTSSLVTLKHLTIERCDDLECLPEYPAHYLSSLQRLQITNCESLKSWPNWLGHQLTSLRKLEIYCSSEPPFLPEQILHLAALHELTIEGYSEETLPDWKENLTSLQTLKLWNCPKLQILPEWVLRVNTTIQSLSILFCPLLKLRYKEETGDDRNKLTHMKSVYIR